LTNFYNNFIYFCYYNSKHRQSK